MSTINKLSVPQSIPYNGFLFGLNHKSSKKQLSESESDKNKIHTTGNKSGPYESLLEGEDLEIEELTKLVAQAGILN